jgi:hypothetical protein
VAVKSRFKCVVGATSSSFSAFPGFTHVTIPVLPWVNVENVAPSKRRSEVTGFRGP